jgi:preprotein translocase subunit SecG
MGFIIGLLTFIMVLDCVVLVALVLIQLPKKDAGAGLAFGGAATDALFGAGSGNVLTKITKYAATIFFVLAIFLGILQSKFSKSGSSSRFLQGMSQAPRPTAGAPAGPATTPSGNAAVPPGPVSSNALLSEATNLPAGPAGTNAPAK